MLWSWARRWWCERRLRNLRASYDAARRAGAPVQIELLEGLSRLLAARSAYTHGHCHRVARHAERIARAMRLPGADIARIRTAAVVHDLGKIYIPREILHKTGPLSEEEYEIVKRHAADGADMLAPVKDPALAAIVRHHHERIDGSGYPVGLLGEQIPLGARIVAVADTFDALTSNRPYRRASSHKKGMEILAGEAGAQLDRQAVDAFLQRYSPRRSSASIALLAAISARAVSALRPVASTVATSGASIAQLAPALGAAGLLALAPQAHNGAGSTARHGIYALRLAHTSATRAVRAHAPKRSAAALQARHGTGRVRHRSPGPRAYVPHRPLASSPTGSHTTRGSSQGGSAPAAQTAKGPQAPGAPSPTGSPSSTPAPSAGGTVEEVVKTATEAVSHLPPAPTVTVPTVTVPAPKASLPIPPLGK
jgi:hypothetical protein